MSKPKCISEACIGSFKSPMGQSRTKEIRQLLQDIIDELEREGGYSKELDNAKTRLKEGKMWLGMQLGRLGGEDLNAKRDKEELSK